ncbi:MULTISPECIES: tetratricopeptide repeat protein [Acinetobacter]|uniref:Ancillary SecYEG translocon subunit n=1 Tax=Acinetobacter piscicola TaxID=2006115 RepID=A0A7S7AGV1_9GAMM|nr:MULTISPECIES: tetratricopeptide repeat protein [Acinetobacter]MDM1757757.1 tetratricopeptide repeat protein [Acinetobacter sp. 256-1]MDM1761853.1 tetratricopeptide repeat protein [Acinetobacter sp. 251-1]QOW45001.1 tetratricopeptide repeat protein [Acinetobacter piscicola]
MSAMTDEEQLDSLKSFFKKYGSAMVSGVLIALIAFFGWQYWQKNNLAKAQNQTAKVQQLFDQAHAANGDAKATAALTTAADKLVKEDPDSIQAIQTQFTMAKLAYDQADYAKAERELKKVENSKIDDKGILQAVKIRLADAQFAQKKYDEALKTLSAVNEPTFKSTAEEMKGDVYVAKNDIENAKKSYQAAWDALLERKQERQILQIKLESVGVLVDDPDFERPILETQVDES